MTVIDLTGARRTALSEARSSPFSPTTICWLGWMVASPCYGRKEKRRSRRLIGHDDGAGGGEHAADAVADRDLGAGDLGRSGAAHLAHALLQGVHAVHAGMHIGEAAAIGVERKFAAGGGVA